ncbi:hypothetical protein ACFWZT_16665 [Streptomyces alboflavus]|uniref:hypothetical protein n=1 Tax=Streptomyces alboflavus TaxID=67267 RepID=UPI0036BBB960
MRRSVVLVAGALAAMTALATPAAAVTAAPAAAVANPAPSPLPPLPAPESLITEGISIEGPLINNLGLPKVL